MEALLVHLLAQPGVSAAEVHDLVVRLDVLHQNVLQPCPTLVPVEGLRVAGVPLLPVLRLPILSHDDLTNSNYSPAKKLDEGPPPSSQRRTNLTPVCEENQTTSSV